MTQYQIIAVDTGKDLLQIQTPHHALSVPNNLQGWRAIEEHAAKLQDPLIVSEASGGYERALLSFFTKAGRPCRVVNPARVRAFAASEGIKAKTDPIDAKVIYAFAKEKNLQPLPPVSPEQQKLGELLDRRAQLVEFITREKNHLEHAGKEATASCKRVVRVMEKEVEKIEGLIRHLIQNHPAIAQQFHLLSSVDGVGEVTAWSVLAYLPEITTLSRNKLVALAGIAPFNRDSGNTSGKRRIAGGRAKIRRALYMAAHTAATHNPVISSYVRGLRDRGKPYKCAIVAAMRKLLIHLQSLLRSSSQIPLAA
jgi:transposase